MAKNSPSPALTMPTMLAIFGATGDLTARKLIPALWDLYRQGALPNQLVIVGFARKALSHEEFREHVASILKSVRSPKKRAFINLFYYQAGQFEDAAGYASLAKFLGRQDNEWKTCANKLFYLAVPPTYYKTICQHLADSGLTIPCGPDEGWTRVVVEKPFGRDEKTAQELDEMLGRLFKEEQIYRIDHYLGKDTVRNVLAFRFSNSFLEPAWDARGIASMHIRMFEKLEVKGRADFYDEVGALRDVGQNHLLQTLALFTMENPGTFSAEAIRRSRTEALSSLEAFDEEDAQRQSVRGQYDGYRELEGVAVKSQTETYFRVEARLNTPRWRGIPFYLEAGKAMNESKFEVVVTFRHHTPCLCPPGQHYVNQLVYRVQPDEAISLSFWVKKPGSGMVIEQKDFLFDYRTAYKGKQFIEPYAKLLLDVISGDQTLFVSTQEIAASWKFIDPVRLAWNEADIPLQKYEVGSDPLLWPPKTTGQAAIHKKIGYVGLGKMGANMVERLLDHGWDVTAFDPNAEAREKVAASGAAVVDSLGSLVKSLKGSRLIWLMVPHQAVAGVIHELLPFLKKGDTVIDAGNSYFKESVAHGNMLEARGIHFMDVGVSGGPSGARAGACLMIGGDKAIYKKHLGLFSDVATAGGYDYMGSVGAGHFVKMVHNGIEYGMMQAIAEGFAVMKDWHKGELNLERIANLYNHDSVIESRLVGWLKDAYEKYGPDLHDISGSVDASGEGLWTVTTAKELGVPVPIIEGSLDFRSQSKRKPSYTGQVLSALRNMFGGHAVKKSKE
jgi:glucose-6-phosphate 1-dehydrogenase